LHVSTCQLEYLANAANKRKTSPDWKTKNPPQKVLAHYSVMDYIINLYAV
jgi:hypothetical protein